MSVVPEVEALAEAIDGAALGLYVGGSVASAGYQPGISDIDAVALMPAPPKLEVRTRLAGVHERITSEHQNGASLHCAYVAANKTADHTTPHWTWAFGELFRRPFSRIARADLLTHGVIVFGPEPTSWLPPMTTADLRDAARDELTGYWTRALRNRSVWRRDVYVDLGLTVWARADATIREGVLITKSQAIARMRERGVPENLVAEVEKRRAGVPVTLTEEQRDARAATVRQFLTDEFARLLRASP